ncbi:MAG TPA: CcoQ/FixQ family Cbb3-type cytochrome c oxidase assembly chaperone [Verrucomicrobiae bacterium]
MVKNILQDIGGIGLYGVISLCMFFAVFSGALLWAALHRRAFCQRMSALPLDDEKGSSYE